MSDGEDQTKIGSFGKAFPAFQDARVHYLEVVDGVDVGRHHIVPETGAVLGRVPPAQIVLPDSEVSRAHCRLSIVGEDLLVTDLGSTNGTFIDDMRILGAAKAPPGALLRVGRQTLKHESRSSREMALSEELDRDLEKANAYVQALLPPPSREGPVRCDWVYQPSARLGGDAFGYSELSEGVYIGYIVDVAGHGAGAAMHAVSILNVLSRRALPGADMREPSQVLSALNEMFGMDSSAGLCFTIWYGVYDARQRRLAYASAGHHPGYLRLPGGQLKALGTRNPVIGVIDKKVFMAAETTAPAGSVLYLFSDGAFEIVTKEGAQWDLANFLPLLERQPEGDHTESQRLLREVQAIARPGGFDDDVSMLVMTFA